MPLDGNVLSALHYCTDASTVTSLLSVIQNGTLTNLL